MSLWDPLASQIFRTFSRQYDVDPSVESQLGSSWLLCVLYGDIILIVFLEFERVLCKFAPALPSSPAQILAQIKPNKFLKLVWTVRREIGLEFLHIPSFNWTFMLGLGVSSFVVRFTNSFKHFVCLQKLAIFQDVDGS